MVDAVADLPFIEVAPGHSASLLSEQQLGNAFGNRVAVEPVGGIEIGEASGLAELLDPERCDALAEHAAEP